jgi:SAM-dependent methyltransferase
MKDTVGEPPVGRAANRTSAAFERWLTDALARHRSTLRFQELRKGVQALSSLYVERRVGADLAARAVEGRAKRAALATYYAPLHFLAVRCVLARLLPAHLEAVRRVVDLGCGTGAAGAAVALACPTPPALLGIDRSGWAVQEARRTYAAFRLRGRAVRGRLPDAVPRPRPGDLLLLAFVVNELADEPRTRLLHRLAGVLDRGASLLLLEPLAGGVAPWWTAATRSLLQGDGICGEVKQSVERPGWIAELDRAAGLDHRVLGARMLFAPGRGRAPTAAGEERAE